MEPGCHHQKLDEAVKKIIRKAVAQITGESKHVNVEYPVDADTLNQYFLNYLCSCLTEARAHALVPQ